MQHATLKFWFALIGLLLMAAGFFVQQSAKIPLIKKTIAKTSYRASIGLNTVMSKGQIMPEDSGFSELSSLYCKIIVESNRYEGHKTGITTFSDANALWPEKIGLVSGINVSWQDGKKTYTSLQELNNEIDKSFGDSILPWQYGLFFIGFFVNIATFFVTYFPKKTPNPKDNNSGENGNSTEKAGHAKPPHDR